MIQERKTFIILVLEKRQTRRIPKSFCQFMASHSPLHCGLNDTYTSPTVFQEMLLKMVSKKVGTLVVVISLAEKRRKIDYSLCKCI